jgi:hypothetical protein
VSEKLLPNDGGRVCDMDRAFDIAMLTLNFSLHHNACARRFYADGLNNHAGHLTPYMAARVIAATMAALQALKLERHSIVGWLRGEAETARTSQALAGIGDPDKLYRMGEKDGLLLAALGIECGHHLASGMSASGQDREAGLEAKPASPARDSGGAQHD